MLLSRLKRTFCRQ